MNLDHVVFELGGLEVTTVRLGLALLVWVAWSVLAFVAAAIASRRLLWPGTSGGQTVQILLNSFRIEMVLLGLLAALAIVGVRILPLVWVLLALAAVLALSFRSTSEQIWAGLLILWERPFSLGERILVGEYEGEVERVGLRATTLRSEERMAIHVPNSYLTRHAIHNRSKTEGGFGLRISVEVMAHCDSGEVISALRKAAERNNRVRSSPSPKAFMMGFNQRGVQYELRAWVDAYNDALWARNELCRAIQSEFQRAGLQLVAEKATARPSAQSGSRGRTRRSPEREGDAGRGREQDSMRGRDRDFESPREPRGERSRSDRPRERRPPRDSDGSTRRRGRRSEPSNPEPSPVSETPVASDTPEPAQSEPVAATIQETPEPTRETYYAEPEEPLATETEPVEAFTSHDAPLEDEPTPSFGRSKRKVPRR